MRICFAALAVAFCVASAKADIVFDYSVGATYTVLGSDLFQSNLASSSLSGGLNPWGAEPLSTLYNGILEAPAVFNVSVSPTPTTSFTFNLDLGLAPRGYQIDEIATYAGWDSGRDGQSYLIEYSTYDAPTTFINLASPFFNPASGPVQHTKALTYRDTGLLVENVASLRFTFDSFENSGTVYQEFDVVGFAAPVPEPGTLLALAMGAACMRRRRAK